MLEFTTINILNFEPSGLVSIDPKFVLAVSSRTYEYDGDTFHVAELYLGVNQRFLVDDSNGDVLDKIAEAKRA